MAVYRRLAMTTEDSDDDDILFLGGALWYLFLRKKNTPQRTVWTRDWLLRRDDLGAYNTLLTELREEDQKSFLNFLRLSPGLFEGLLEKVSPLIKKHDTYFRKAIPPGMRLAITLRYLATGRFHNVCINVHPQYKYPYLFSNPKK